MYNTPMLSTDENQFKSLTYVTKYFQEEVTSYVA